MNDRVKTHNAAVEEMYQQLKPLVHSYDAPVVLNALLITLAMCGQQSKLDSEMFKALVVQELDRLMLITAQPRGTA